MKGCATKLHRSTNKVNNGTISTWWMYLLPISLLTSYIVLDGLRIWKKDSVHFAELIFQYRSVPCCFPNQPLVIWKGYPGGRGSISHRIGDDSDAIVFPEAYTRVCCSQIDPNTDVGIGRTNHSDRSWLDYVNMEWVTTVHWSLWIASFGNYWYRSQRSTEF